jgi:hypothetical protein
VHLRKYKEDPKAHAEHVALHGVAVLPIEFLYAAAPEPLQLLSGQCSPNQARQNHAKNMILAVLIPAL